MQNVGTHTCACEADVRNWKGRLTAWRTNLVKEALKRHCFFYCYIFTLLYNRGSKHCQPLQVILQTTCLVHLWKKVLSSNGKYRCSCVLSGVSLWQLPVTSDSDTWTDRNNLPVNEIVTKPRCIELRHTNYDFLSSSSLLHCAFGRITLIIN